MRNWRVRVSTCDLRSSSFVYAQPLYNDGVIWGIQDWGHSRDPTFEPHTVPHTHPHPILPLHSMFSMVQVQDGGGWTMVLHTYYTGSYPPGGNSQYAQSYANWRTRGIGNILVSFGCVSLLCVRSDHHHSSPHSCALEDFHHSIPRIPRLGLHRTGRRLRE